MTCQSAAKLRSAWYEAAQQHGRESLDYAVTFDAYKAHRQGCMLCKAELQQPQVVKLFEVENVAAAD